MLHATWDTTVDLLVDLPFEDQSALPLTRSN